MSSSHVARIAKACTNSFMKIFFAETTMLILLFKHANEKLIISKLKWSISLEKNKSIRKTEKNDLFIYNVNKLKKKLKQIE